MSAALLLSGGVDSTALAALEKPQIALVIDYGQRAAVAEVRASTSIASRLEIPLKVLSIDCSVVGRGDMAASELTSDLAPVSEWWPFRNQLLVTLAAASLVDDSVDELVIGTVAGDQVHADGRREFVETLDRLLSIQEGGLRLRAPALGMRSAELVQSANLRKGILAWTHSCHRANYACGRCRGCNKRAEVFAELGL